MLNFGNRDTEFPVPNSAASVHGVPEVKRKKKNWQTNCGNAIAKIRESIFFFIAIVTMALPKMGGKK